VGLYSNYNIHYIYKYIMSNPSRQSKKNKPKSETRSKKKIQSRNIASIENQIETNTMGMYLNNEVPTVVPQDKSYTTNEVDLDNVGPNEGLSVVPEDNPNTTNEVSNEYEPDYEEQNRILTEKISRCKEECEKVQKEKNDLDEFRIKRKIEGITLSTDKKLIDLLIDRILDLSDHWKDNLLTLINIPTSLKGKDYLRGGDYFEALFQIAIATQLLPMVQNKYIKFCDVSNYKNMIDVSNYLHEKTIKNSGGAEQGISDITFKVSNNLKDFDNPLPSDSYDCGTIPSTLYDSASNHVYFCSVKGFKREKSIKDDYDIPLLYKQSDLFPELNKHLIVCVRNKGSFMKKLERTKMEFLKNGIHHIIGYDEIIDAFADFRCNFFRKLQTVNVVNIKRQVHHMFPRDILHKPFLSLYFHQELVVKSVIERIHTVQDKDKPHFLCIGVLPRGGKSFIAGGIIDTHKKTMNKDDYQVLFLTSAVNETRDQFKKDLIEKFSDFQDFDFIDVVHDKIDTKVKKSKFYFISRQLTTMDKTTKIKPVLEDIPTEKITEGMLVKLREKVGDMKPDIIFFDEAHIGSLSDKMKQNFHRAFESYKIPIVLMSATYKKPSILLNSSKDLFIWDLEDVILMKSLPTMGLEGMSHQLGFMERYPAFSMDLLRRRINQGETLEHLSQPYLQFPEPKFISLTFSPESIKRLHETNAEYAFADAFKIQKDKDSILLKHEQYLEWGKLLTNREDARKIRQFLTPEQEDHHEEPGLLQHKNRKFRALNQIFEIAQKYGSRPMIGKPFSILMFLPTNIKDCPIGELCRIWASFMLETNYWKEHFVFLTLSEYVSHTKDPEYTLQRVVKKGLCHIEDIQEKDLKRKILSIEREALKEGKGLILLTGNVASMGISLKCIDVVFLMSDISEADDLIQKMYRALTDDPPDKKFGFIVDLDLKRMIKATYEYGIVKDKTRNQNCSLISVKERIQTVFNLCDWGQEMFIADHPEMDFTEIMNEIRDRVLKDVETDIHTMNQSQIQNIEKTIIGQLKLEHDLYSDILDTLRLTNPPGKRPRISVTKYPRGEDIPGVSKPNTVHEPKYNPLSEEEINKKIFHIVKTFVNTLILKSEFIWTEPMNMSSLIERYFNDKIKRKGLPVCECNTNECNKDHNNLYEIVYCELSQFAFFTRNKKQVYDAQLHKKIIDMVEKIFTQSMILSEWDIYTEKLIHEIKSPVNN